MVELATTIWADGPALNPHEPQKSDIRAWGTWIEGIINAFASNGGLIYSSLAALNADLAKPANSMAWVVGDPVTANNGVYGKVGASGTGSWTRRADLPFSFIVASDTGTGTPNAIVATTNIPVSGSALIWMSVAQTNTASLVTISFNGGLPLTVKTNGGSNVAAGGLVAGMIVLGIVSGSTFRLVSDQASAAIVAAAEAAADRAELARDAAEAAASGVNLPPAIPLSYLRQKSDLSGYEALTAAQTADDLNQAVVGIISDGTARSARARFGDRLDIKEFGFDVSGAIGTEEANNAALDRLIAYAASNPGRVYTARNSDTVRFSSFGKTIPRSVLRFAGARFIWAGSLGASPSPVLTMAAGTEIDSIRFEVPAGGTFRRFLDFASDNVVSEVSLACDTQVNNEGGSNLDRAIRFFGHRHRIGMVKTKNVDNCVLIWGDGGAGSPQTGSFFSGFVFENYAKGGLARNAKQCTFGPTLAFGKSVNALPNPGYNAWLWEGMVECVVGARHLYDAGEHNERWGGPHSGEQVTRDCVVGDLLSGRAGQCGFKLWPGLNTDTIFGMTFGNIETLDCGLYAQQGNTAPPQFNDFGAMIQNLAKSSVGRVLSYTKAATYAALDNVYLSQMNDVEVAAVQGYNASRNILRISEYNGSASDSNSTNSLRVGRVTGSGNSAEDILVEVPTASFRDVQVDDFWFTGGSDAVRWTGAAARAVQRCYFYGAARNITGAQFNIPTGTNLKAKDKWTA